MGFYAQFEEKRKQGSQRYGFYSQIEQRYGPLLEKMREAREKAERRRKIIEEAKAKAKQGQIEAQKSTHPTNVA